MNPRLQRAVALAFIVAGVLCNPWILAALVSSKLLHQRYALAFILVLSGTSLALGIFLLRAKPRTVLRQILMIGLSIVLMTILAECGLRGFYLATNGLSQPNRYVTRDLGWETTPDIQLTYEQTGYGQVIYSTQKDGFRKLSERDKTTTHVLVLGDSVTQASQVSDGHAYFDVLDHELPDLSVSAVGTGGYGSLQEYMFLDRCFDSIQPDLVVWQFSDNDFINNDHRLECLSNANNNHMTRPYLVDGKIQYLFPASNFHFVQRNSYLVRHIMIVSNVLLAHRVGTIEDDLSFDDPRFQHAMRTTSEIMGMVRERVGPTPIVAFSAYGGPAPQYQRRAFREICAQHSIHFVDEVTEAIQRASLNGEVIDGSPHDLHWNNRGHRIAGTVLASFLRSEIIPELAGKKTIDSLSSYERNVLDSATSLD